MPVFIVIKTETIVKTEVLMVKAELENDVWACLNKKPLAEETIRDLKVKIMVAKGK